MPTTRNTAVIGLTLAVGLGCGGPNGPTVIDSPPPPPPPPSLVTECRSSTCNYNGSVPPGGVVPYGIIPPAVGTLTISLRWSSSARLALTVCPTLAFQLLCLPRLQNEAGRVQWTSGVGFETCAINMANLPIRISEPVAVSVINPSVSGSATAYMLSITIR
jgi:hypothetical protein